MDYQSAGIKNLSVLNHFVDTFNINLAQINLCLLNAGSAQKHVVTIYNTLLVDPSKPILVIL